MQHVPVAPPERKVRRSGSSMPAIKPDRLKTAKEQVEKAVKMRKVFSVQGPYPVIRAALRSRGWVERRLPHPVRRSAYCHDDEEEEESGVDVAEQVREHGKEESLGEMCDLMSHLVRNVTPYFYWTTRRDDVDGRCLRNDQMTNHFANAGTFTTKVGLCVNLRNLQWFDAADPDTFFPRCYRLGAEDDKQAFIDDFRRTACISLLQYVVETSACRRDGAAAEKTTDGACEESGSSRPHRVIGSDVVSTALRACQEFLCVSEHGDIDATAETPPAVKEQQWAEFLQDYYAVAHEGAWVRGSSSVVARCRATLTRLRAVCPQLDTDGLNNIWIVKPGAKSRGRGISCMNGLDGILALADTDRAASNESRWVVQKYLERPLLVHGTKFDLRQWFLVTDWNPLTVWFYRECYLRFSTQPYSTNTLDSAVHLCNNSIQKHLRPSRDRHPGVPEDNMWSCSQFRAFLRQQGREAEWESVVVPGMQQAVVGALQTAQDLVEPRKASFELYGADFMLGRDLKPWLLEINASPTMACSTSVTARLCPAVQLDTLRVVLDRRADPSACTGGFHLICKQAAVEVPQYVGVNLLVEGLPVRRPRPLLLKETKAPFVLPLDQSSSERAATARRLLGPKLRAVAAFQCSGKENRAAGEKKRRVTSMAPYGDGEGGAPVQNTSCVRGLVVVHVEPRRKARRLALCLDATRAALVPRSLSFSLGPLKSPPDAGKTRPRPGPNPSSHPPTPFLPQATADPQHKTSAGDFPSPRDPLPALRVLSLRPNFAAAARLTLVFPSHASQLLLSSDRRSMGRCKADGTEEHKH